MSLLHAENEIEDMTDMHDSGRDREISLGTSTLIGVFFALALVCSAFFGFGYSLGRKSAQTVARPMADSGVSASTGGGLFKSFKPAPGSAAKAGSGSGNAASAPDADTPSGSIVVPVTKAEAAPVARKTFDPDAQVVGDPVGCCCSFSCGRARRDGFGPGGGGLTPGGCGYAGDDAPSQGIQRYDPVGIAG
jgi:hypothetical protein